MASRELQRLRSAERDLANWYKNYLQPSRRQGMDDLKAMRRGYNIAGQRDAVNLVNREIEQRTREATAALYDLQAEVQAATAAVQARAQRKRPVATEAAKQDIRNILSSPTASISGVSMWIAQFHKDQSEYWSALEEIVSQQVAGAGPIGAPASRARTMQKDLEEALLVYEPLTYSPQEQQAALEAREVGACQAYLHDNIKTAGEFLDRESQGLDGILPRQGIQRWSGLPDAQHPNGLLTPGNSSIMLMDDKGNFSVAADQLQEV